jgi:hypothetical protein
MKKTFEILYIMPFIEEVTEPLELKAIEDVKQFYYSQNIEKSRTFHQYCNTLPDKMKTVVDLIKYGKIMHEIFAYYPGQTVDAINGMNEIYVSSIGAAGSDRVFETPHLDGPFFFLPFCTVLRTVLAIQGNRDIATDFPAVHARHSLETNEFLVFDYNRDVHFISKFENTQNNVDRILLKLHYIVTPSFVPFSVVQLYSALHSKYNSLMRTIFLHSQKNGEKENLLSVFVNKGTLVYYYLYYHIGMYNALLFVILLWKPLHLFLF